MLSCVALILVALFAIASSTGGSTDGELEMREAFEELVTLVDKRLDLAQQMALHKIGRQLPVGGSASERERWIELAGERAQKQGLRAQMAHSVFADLNAAIQLTERNVAEVQQRSNTQLPKGVRRLADLLPTEAPQESALLEALVAQLSRVQQLAIGASPQQLQLFPVVVRAKAWTLLAEHAFNPTRGQALATAIAHLCDISAQNEAAKVAELDEEQEAFAMVNHSLLQHFMNEEFRRIKEQGLWHQQTDRLEAMRLLMQTRKSFFWNKPPNEVMAPEPVPPIISSLLLGDEQQLQKQLSTGVYDQIALQRVMEEEVDQSKDESVRQQFSKLTKWILEQTDWSNSRRQLASIVSRFRHARNVDCGKSNSNSPLHNFPSNHELDGLSRLKEEHIIPLQEAILRMKVDAFYVVLYKYLLKKLKQHTTNQNLNKVNWLAALLEEFQRAYIGHRTDFVDGLEKLEKALKIECSCCYPSLSAQCSQMFEDLRADIVRTNALIYEM